MPTVAEPIWQERQERAVIALNNFIEAKPNTIDDMESVLRARLFGLGLRGQDLDTEVRLAKIAKYERSNLCQRK